MKAWHTMFREADGTVSMTRCALAFSIVVILGTWSSLCFRHDQVLEIPPGVVTIVIALCGLKWGQQKGESECPPQ